jgi:hypothetical protein
MKGYKFHRESCFGHGQKLSSLRHEDVLKNPKFGIEIDFVTFLQRNAYNFLVF